MHKLKDALLLQHNFISKHRNSFQRLMQVKFYSMMTRTQKSESPQNNYFRRSQRGKKTSHHIIIYPAYFWNQKKL